MINVLVMIIGLITLLVMTLGVKAKKVVSGLKTIIKPIKVKDPETGEEYEIDIMEIYEQVRKDLEKKGYKLPEDTSSAKSETDGLEELVRTVLYSPQAKLPPIDESKTDLLMDALKKVDEEKYLSLIHI